MPLDTHLTKYHCFLIYRVFAFLSNLRPQWYCRTIPDPANSTWVKKYPIVEVRYKVTLAASIVLVMTTSKEILPGIRFCGWAELIINESSLFSSGLKNSPRMRTSETHELKTYQALWLHELSMPLLTSTYFKRSKFDHLLFGTAPCKLTAPNTGYPVGAQNTGVLIFVGRHCIKKRYYGKDSSAYKWKHCG